jgi:predicted DNA-binding transcriptional regulator YafY
MNSIERMFLAALAALANWPRKFWSIKPKISSTAVHAAARNTPAQNELWLADWREVQRVPIFKSVHPTAQRLILAAGRQEMLTLRYWGGSTPGGERKVSPTSVFQIGGYGPLYLCGYCHVRRAERVFRVERVELLLEAGDIICITE